MQGKAAARGRDVLLPRRDPPHPPAPAEAAGPPVTRVTGESALSCGFPQGSCAGAGWHGRLRQPECPGDPLPRGAGGPRPHPTRRGSPTLLLPWVRAERVQRAGLPSPSGCAHGLWLSPGARCVICEGQSPTPPKPQSPAPPNPRALLPPGCLALASRGRSVSGSADAGLCSQ